MRKPSKKVLSLFAEAETIAAQLLELRAEENRLREMLEKVWRTRVTGMAMLAAKADIAAKEVAESERGRKGKP